MGYDVFRIGDLLSLVRIRLFSYYDVFVVIFKMKTSPLKKVLSFIYNFIIWSMIVIASVFVIVTLSANKDGIPRFLGYTLFTVQSNSMKGSTSKNFNRGDMIVGKEVTSDQIKALKKDDIITFKDILRDEDGSTEIVNTHRIIEVIKDEKSNEISFRTKGDNNPEEDKTLVRPADVIAKFNFKFFIPGTGFALNFLKEPTGFLLCLVFPVFLFFLWRLYKLIFAIIKYQKVKIQDELNEAANENATDENIAAKKVLIPTTEASAPDIPQAEAASTVEASATATDSTPNCCEAVAPAKEDSLMEEISNEESANEETAVEEIPDEPAQKADVITGTE